MGHVLIKTAPLVNLDKMVARNYLSTAAVTLLLSTPSLAQSNSQSDGSHLSIWPLEARADSVRICVAYSIPFGRIVFEKENEGKHGFLARLTFYVDASDSARQINYPAFSQSEVETETFSVTRSRKESAEDFVVMKLPSSSYRISAQVRDETQGISYINTTLQGRFSAPDSTGILGVSFLDSLSGRDYFPVFDRDSAPFPRKIRVAVLKYATRGQVSLSLNGTDGRLICDAESTISHSERLEPVRAGNRVHLVGMPDKSLRIFSGEFLSDTLGEGMLQLEVHSGERKSSFPFCYSWTDKPKTLRNFNLALSLLKYIVADSIYSWIDTGSEAEAKRRFDMFWRSQAPSPNTAYNELEAEYYRRADYALEHFGSTATRNGASTDRGKAYILMGPPTHIRREFRNDGTYEIWEYPKMNRKMVFRGRSFGEFRLYQTESL